MRQLKVEKSFMPREFKNTLDNYLIDIGKLELVTADEEVELAKRIKKGDKEALDKLVNANLRFVVSVAKQYQNRGLPLTDLISEGNLGLIRAAELFDETKGFKFISYAVWWIRQSILQAINNHSRNIGIPLNQEAMLSKIKKIVHEFEQEHCRKPTDGEVAIALGIDEDDIKTGNGAMEKIRTMLGIASGTVSLDSPSHVDDDRTIGETVEDSDSPSPEKLAMGTSLSIDLNRVLSVLKENERLVLIKHFGLSGNREMTLDEIAAEIGLTRERVRQLREKGLKKIRTNPTAARLLRSHLG